MVFQNHFWCYRSIFGVTNSVWWTKFWEISRFGDSKLLTCQIFWKMIDLKPVYQLFQILSTIQPSKLSILLYFIFHQPNDTGFKPFTTTPYQTSVPSLAPTWRNHPPIPIQNHRTDPLIYLLFIFLEFIFSFTTF